MNEELLYITYLPASSLVFFLLLIQCHKYITKNKAVLNALSYYLSLKIFLCDLGIALVLYSTIDALSLIVASVHFALHIRLIQRYDAVYKRVEILSNQYFKIISKKA